jgi:pimeloyl-ACP methyl ester carboxylesterase
MGYEIRSEWTKVGKLDIRYITGGQGEPLVVIHGGGDGANSWLANVAELSKRYTIYLPDLPGFGHSQSISDSVQLSEFVDFVDEFTNSLGLERFNLAGHSLGGGIALQYALKFPGKITRLVLISSMCLGKEIALWARVLSSSTFCRSFGEAVVAILKGTWSMVKFFYSPFQMANPVSRTRLSIGKNIMTLEGQTTVLQDELCGLTMPTLLVWGANDGIVPVSHAYTAAQLIPDCHLKVFEGCGHSVYREKLAEFCQVLSRFLG